MPPAPAKPPLPDTVRHAYNLMLAGGAVQALGILVLFTQTDQIREAVRESLRNEPNVTERTIDAGVTLGITLGVVFGLIGAGLWIWMAFANKAGKNWARITGTVFFGIATLSALTNLASAGDDNSAMAGTSTGLGIAVSLLNWAIGLAVIILLWHPKSSGYFKPRAEYSYGYQPPGQQGYPYPPSGPPPGQQPPYGQQPPPGQPPGGGQPHDQDRGPGEMPPPR